MGNIYVSVLCFHLIKNSFSTSLNGIESNGGRT